MDVDLAQSALVVAKSLQDSANRAAPLPSEVSAPADQPVLPHALFIDSRGDIRKVVFQVNACYTATCYDACAVMIRRLIEVLIIESYEHHNRGSEIKDASNNYFMLKDLTNKMLSGSWTLSRTTKKGLKGLKTFGDLSAHSRKYNAQRGYVDDVIVELRVITEELLYLSGMRS